MKLDEIKQKTIECLKKSFCSRAAWFSIIKILLTVVLLGIIANIIVSKYTEKMTLNRTIFESYLPQFEKQFNRCTEYYDEARDGFQERALLMASYHDNYHYALTEKDKFAVYKNFVVKVQVNPEMYLVNGSRCVNDVLAKIQNLNQLLGISRLQAEPLKESSTELLSLVKSLKHISQKEPHEKEATIDFVRIDMLPLSLQFRRYSQSIYKQSLMMAARNEELVQIAINDYMKQKILFNKFMSVYTYQIKNVIN